MHCSCYSQARTKNIDTKLSNHFTSWVSYKICIMITTYAESIFIEDPIEANIYTAVSC